MVKKSSSSKKKSAKPKAKRTAGAAPLSTFAGRRTEALSRPSSAYKVKVTAHWRRLPRHRS